MTAFAMVSVCEAAVRQGMLHRSRTWTVFVHLARGCAHQVHRRYRGDRLLPPLVDTAS